MFPPLYENSKGHWNRYIDDTSTASSAEANSCRTIHSMVYNAMKMFMEINPQLFDECSHEYNERQNSAEERELGRQQRWEKVLERAKDRKNGVTVPPQCQVAEIPVHLDDIDQVAHESQKRLHALKLDDSSSTERRPRESTASSVSTERPE